MKTARSTIKLLCLLVVVAGCAVDPPLATTGTVAVVPPPTITSDPSPTSTIPSSPVTPATTVPSTIPPSTTTIPLATTTLAPLQGLDLEVIGDGFDQPVLAVTPPGDTRLFVVERTGVIRLVGAETPFLDLTDRVNSNGIEQGLLGLAFHPDYAANGRLFVFYYRSGVEQTRLAEFSISTDPDQADPDSEISLLDLDKPTTRHNGGMLEFGPDGLLYVSLGEGGAASIHSQDPGTLLSSILRIDVDQASPYGVPADNPFVDGGGAPEVWAYGLRNPWRFSIDQVDGQIYVADVGHERWEEINVVALATGGGTNFGWLRMEGTHCFQSGCDPVAENLTLPVLEYSHDEGCAVTGGYVYRGAAIPELTGHYLYGDWCGGWVRSFRMVAGEVTETQELLTGVGQIDGFGQDGAGELYVMTWEGLMAKLVPVR